MNQNIRLNKYLAGLGVASRRAIDQLIEQGKVLVNDKQAVVGQKIDPKTDKVLVNGKPVDQQPELAYFLFHKPKGILSTTKDTHFRKTVLDMVKVPYRLFPVGRLDKDSEGLILLTNDGELAYKLTHPKFHVPKTYHVTVLGRVNSHVLQNLKSGVDLEDGKTKPAQVKILSQIPHHTVLEIVLYEGRKRQIRRMCSVLHLHILRLIRVKIGNLELGDIKPGKLKRLSQKEVYKLTEFNSEN
ncbi:rRNA pseudouridine synthase [Candidatus Beckwithbacteria bacterium]|nr:rRNA pseudouridine synthase [Candidatus Beckwithbacteria bacterium]